MDPSTGFRTAIIATVHHTKNKTASVSLRTLGTQKPVVFALGLFKGGYRIYCMDGA